MGGRGLRLRSLTDNRPKAMVPVCGRPLVDWVLRWLAKNAIEQVVIGVAYQKEQIIDYVGEGRRHGMNLQYSHHTVEGGTAQGFRLAIERYVDDDDFVAMNGDELTNIDLRDFGSYHVTRGGTATIAVSPLRCPFGVLKISGEDVLGFQEKPLIDSLPVSIGIYMFQRRILDYLPKVGDIEKTVFPRLASEKKLKAYRHDGFWMTINTLKDLEDVEKRVLEMGV